MYQDCGKKCRLALSKTGPECTSRQLLDLCFCRFPSMSAHLLLMPILWTPHVQPCHAVNRRQLHSVSCFTRSQSHSPVQLVCSILLIKCCLFVAIIITTAQSLYFTIPHRLFEVQAVLLGQTQPSCELLVVVALVVRILYHLAIESLADLGFLAVLSSEAQLLPLCDLPCTGLLDLFLYTC